MTLCFTDAGIIPTIPGQLSLAIPSWVGAMSTSRMVRVWVAGKTDPLVTRGPYLSALEMELIY